MAIKFFAFFFWQSVLSDVFGLNGRHHWQLRAAAQRCGAGGCRREATWIHVQDCIVFHLQLIRKEALDRCSVSVTMSNISNCCSSHLKDSSGGRKLTGVTMIWEAEWLLAQQLSKSVNHTVFLKSTTAKTWWHTVYHYMMGSFVPFVARLPGFVCASGGSGVVGSVGFPPFGFWGCCGFRGSRLGCSFLAVVCCEWFTAPQRSCAVYLGAVHGQSDDDWLLVRCVFCKPPSDASFLSLVKFSTGSGREMGSPRHWQPWPNRSHWEHQQHDLSPQPALRLDGVQRDTACNLWAASLIHTQLQPT